MILRSYSTEVEQRELDEKESDSIFLHVFQRDNIIVVVVSISVIYEIHSSSNTFKNHIRE